MTGFLQSTGFMPPSQTEYQRNTMGVGGSLGGFSPGFLPPFQAVPKPPQQNQNASNGLVMQKLINDLRSMPIGGVQQQQPPIAAPIAGTLPTPTNPQNQVQGLK
jgi:hypothetical protein